MAQVETKHASVPKFLLLLEGLLALGGLGVSTYLTFSYTAASSELMICSTSGCDAVRNSECSCILGVPVPIIGLAGYVVVLAVVASQAFGNGVAKERSAQVMMLLTFCGFLFSVYLTCLEIFVIKAMCDWCMASAAIMTALMLLSIYALVSGRRRKRGA